jgi:hypothetical protein
MVQYQVITVRIGEGQFRVPDRYSQLRQPEALGARVPRLAGEDPISWPMH